MYHSTLGSRVTKKKKKGRRYATTCTSLKSRCVPLPTEKGTPQTVLETLALKTAQTKALSAGSCFPPLHAAARIMDLLFAEVKPKP